MKNGKDYLPQQYVWSATIIFFNFARTKKTHRESAIVKWNVERADTLTKENHIQSKMIENDEKK